MPPSRIIRQRDFSGGELSDTAKRRDDLEQMRASGRQMRNWRCEALGNLRDRPGRIAQFTQTGRTQTILLPGEIKFRISFGNGTIVIRNPSTGAVVGSASGYPWTSATVGQISFAVINRDVLICFPGSVPKVARRDPASGAWSFFDFGFAVGYQGELRAPFYRFPETIGITLRPSARTGTIQLYASAPLFVSGHIGCNFRFKGYQVQVTAITSSTQATANVLQPLPPAQILTVASIDGFFVGQVIAGNKSNATGEVTATSGSTVTVQLKSIYTGFEAGETIVSPTSRTTINTGGVASTTLQASVDWDEQAASNYRGWPRGCLYDRSRLAMFDMPQVPEGIIWSSISAYADFYVGADASNAIFELVPGRKHVLYMLGGPDQFVFTDGGVYYIPISESNPLKPGSVSFVRITSDGAGVVQPVETADGLLFCNAGLSRIIAIVQTGTVTKPYSARDITQFCSHLIKSPVCMAAATGDGDFPERYVYVVNADGTLAVGRLTSSEKWVGFVPWDGAGIVKWASATGAEVLFTTNYVGTATQSIVEILSDNYDLDCSVTLNSVVSTLAPGIGQGPLWFWAGASVDLIDSGRDLGRRSVDTNGNIVTLLNDDFSSATITAGRGWTSTFEPWVPHVQEGRDFGQTLRRRKLSNGAVAVEHSVGFDWGGRTIPAYNWGEDGGLAPVEREQTYKFKSLGRSVDPRAVLSKDRPGSIKIVEVSLEVTI